MAGNTSGGARGELTMRKGFATQRPVERRRVSVSLAQTCNKKRASRRLTLRFQSTASRVRTRRHFEPASATRTISTRCFGMPLSSRQKKNWPIDSGWSGAAVMIATSPTFIVRLN